MQVDKPVFEGYDELHIATIILMKQASVNLWMITGTVYDTYY